MSMDHRFPRDSASCGGAIEVGVVVAGHGAVHAASAGKLGCAYNRRQHLCMQRDLVADTVRHPERNHLR